MREARDANVNSNGIHALTTQSNIMTLIEANSSSDNDNSKLIEMMIGSLNISGGNNLLTNMSNSSLLTDKSNGTSIVTKNIANDDNDLKNNTNTNTKSDTRDFREGGLGRSRNRKGTFKKDRIRGMYDHIDDNDDNDDNDEKLSVRKPGKVVLLPRNSNELGYLCYVVDNNDNLKRACPKRTIVDLIGVFEGLGIEVLGISSLSLLLSSLLLLLLLL